MRLAFAHFFYKLVILLRNTNPYASFGKCAWIQDIYIVPAKSNAQKIKFFHATRLSEGEEPGPGDESQVEDDFHS
jgi:hypothetical protein